MGSPHMGKRGVGISCCFVCPFFWQSSAESFEESANENGSRVGCERLAWKVLLAMIAVQAGGQQLGVTGQNMTALNKARQASPSALLRWNQSPCLSVSFPSCSPSCHTSRFFPLQPLRFIFSI